MSDTERLSIFRDPMLRQAWRCGWNAVRDMDASLLETALKRTEIYMHACLQAAGIYAAQPEAKREVLIYLLAHPAIDAQDYAVVESRFGTAVACLNAEMQKSEEDPDFELSPLAVETVQAMMEPTRMTMAKIGPVLEDMAIRQAGMWDTVRDMRDTVGRIEEYVRGETADARARRLLSFDVKGMRPN